MLRAVFSLPILPVCAEAVPALVLGIVPVLAPVVPTGPGAARAKVAQRPGVVGLEDFARVPPSVSPDPGPEPEPEPMPEPEPEPAPRRDVKENEDHKAERDTCLRTVRGGLVVLSFWLRCA